MFVSSLILLAGGAAMAVADGCHGDNLLRAMERHNGTMYCSMLLNSGDATGTLSLPDPMPTSYPALSVTSACSCLLSLDPTPRAPCHANSTSTPAADYSTEVDDPGATNAASATAASDSHTIPTAHATFAGGYSYSFPGPAIPSETASTCGWSEVTATVQVTETQVSTIYIYSSEIPNPSSAQSLSSVSDGDSGGRPVPLSTTKTITGNASGTASGFVSTVTLIGDSTVSLPTQPGTTVESTAAVPRVITVTNGNYTTVKTIFGSASEPSSTKSMVGITSVINGVTTTITGAPGSSSWSLSWLSSTTGAPSQQITVGTPIVPPAVTTITSDVGGVASTWVVTLGRSTSSGPFANSSTPTQLPTPETTPGAFTVFTSIINGDASTWTVIGGSTLVGSPNSTSPTSTPSPSQAAEVSIITSVNGGVASTWTVIGGTTVGNPSNGSAVPTPALTPSATETGAFSVITSVVGGVGSTWTVIGGSTLARSPTLSATPSIITSIIGGVASSWTVIGGSTISVNPSEISPSPTVSGAATVFTSVIGGVVSTWVVIGGSTMVNPTNATGSTPTPATTVPSATTASSDLPPGASIVTSIIGGVASSWTVIGGSTISPIASPPSASGELPPGATVITSVIGGIASSWTVIGGSTIFASSDATAGSPTATATPTAITSVIDGVASTWTVVGGSTIFGTLTPGSLSLITPTAVSLTGGATFVSTVNGTAPTAGSSSSTTGVSSAPASTSATSTSTYDSAFTGISVIVAQNATSCYALPTPTASLHESLLNVTNRTPPYIDAFYLNETTHSVQYLRLIDNATNPVLVDVSDPSRLGILDKAGNVLSIDSEGLHFASANCSPKIDVFISGFFQQLNTLTNSTCTNTTDIPVNGTDPRRLPVFKGTLAEMAQDAFDITLHLKDQCGNPARADLPVSVALGDTQCIVLPDATGDFVANCAFPGSGSGSMECETSVQQTLDHLTQGSLVGSCPPLTSVWNLLFQQLGSVINVDELLQPFIDAGLQLGSDAGKGILAVIDSFMNLYDFSAATFKNSTSGSGSGLGDIVEGYGVTTIKTEVCRSLISTETLNLTFTAGTSTTPISLANITALPSSGPEYERNITDPTALACCPNANACIVQDGERFYPPEASIPDSDCLCGKTLEGGGIGFRTGRCVGAILVTGATGKQGGAVIDALLESETGSTYKIIAVTRNVASSKAKSLASRGVIVIQGDLNDVPAIFSDAKAALSSSNTELWGLFSVQTAIGKGASAELEEAQGKALVDAALSNNIKFFTYSSIDRGGDGSYDNYVPSVSHFVSKYRIEHHLVEEARGKMDWTILRPVAFMENMEPGMGTKIMATSWRVAVKDKPLQLVSVKDVGRAAAKAFLHPQEFAGRQIPLAGDELTLEAASAIFKSKKGTEIPETFQFLVRFLHWMIPEFGAMYRWFYTDGFGVDIAAVKRENSGMLDFGSWVKKEYDQDGKRV
ncbi:hypothetical protein CTAM01_14886 [Colletotrichum tamarilloi]|uniref:NmrA-like domain-containing protein n=1 Tax=Colletotrichum tamarilloi TaxID=1209934 RepID=A0ABQ9QN43_9PEZI|nr:uncharacterized protein CTAM01_14886 [Colletotrichum tamarilloi]KAK1479022.1 hypothetical protein CTAM01_14886 [Colletotrichum tamarilloi]